MAVKTSLRHRAVVAALAAVLAVSLAACGDDDDKEKATVNVTEVPASALPAELMGMKVQPEPSLDLAKRDRPYFEAVGLFSMRQGDLLQATLQVSRFTADAKVDDQQFRDTVAGQIGSGTPQILRMGKQLVYVTAGRRQSLSVWFKDRTMYVLAVREEYPQPRALLRQAVEIKP